jgi:hypothetical protein
VRTALSLLALAAALLAPAASASPTAKAPTPRVICGTACDGGGGGWSGCTQTSASDSGGIPYVAGYRHVLVVSYCKRYGVITSVSIAAHYCDTSGFVGCMPGPAWQTGGGVGYGYATFTGRATWTGTIAGAPYNSTTVVDLTIPYG